MRVMAMHVMAMRVMACVQPPPLTLNKEMLRTLRVVQECVGTCTLAASWVILAAGPELLNNEGLSEAHDWLALIT